MLRGDPQQHPHPKRYRTSESEVAHGRQWQQAEDALKHLGWKRGEVAGTGHISAFHLSPPHQICHRDMTVSITQSVIEHLFFQIIQLVMHELQLRICKIIIYLNLYPGECYL